HRAIHPGTASGRTAGNPRSRKPRRNGGPPLPVEHPTLSFVQDGKTEQDMKAPKYSSLWMPLLAAMLIAGGGCDFGSPFHQASGGGTSVDGLTGNLAVAG